MDLSLLASFDVSSFFYWVPRLGWRLHIIHSQMGVRRSLIRLSLKPFVRMFRTGRTVGMSVSSSLHLFTTIRWIQVQRDRKRQKKSPKWQGDRVQRKLNFQWRNEQMAMSVIQSVSNPAPLILLWLFPEAYPCVARNEFYKTMSCLISPRPPHRDHTSLHSPLPHPLSMHFKVQVRRKVTNFLY